MTLLHKISTFKYIKNRC